MTAPNRNTLWADVFVAELAESGVDAVCLAPGSRSTPLTLAFARHPAIQTFSHLDERSAAFFALGRGKQTGRPTPVVCTSGTAAANFHPAVLEAHEARVPVLLLTADRPPELHDSGANQTTTQHDLFGDAVRYSRTLPEPAVEGRKLRSLRVVAARSVAETTGSNPGPVHLNVPFRKPLEPTPVPDDIPTAFETREPLAARGREGRPFVATHSGRVVLDERDRKQIERAVAQANRGLIVCGPANGPEPSREALAALADATGFPVLADPLSGHRFGSPVPVCGGYDSYLAGADEWPEPDVVIRFGASPTSKVLRKYLASVSTHQFLVDPAGGWREAEFTATDLVSADPTRFATELAASVNRERGAYSERFDRAEQTYWNLLTAERTTWFEGNILRTVAERIPAPATLFVSNSMPVRDLDRFGKPRDSDLSVLGNRGVSGIDGIISTALGAGSATDDPLVLVLGDLAFYHDMNGLLALSRCAVDATIVLIDNDGGGIFHKLPISEFEPPFTEQFITPHGLDFEPVSDLYDFSFERFETIENFAEGFENSVTSDGTQLLSVAFDSDRSHEKRDEIHERVTAEIRGMA